VQTCAHPIYQVHQHALKAENHSIKSIVKQETVDNYYNNLKNKGWIGNSIEEDWFGVINNNRDEPDIPYLNLEIKITPIIKTKRGWSYIERLVLNIFNFHEEYKSDFFDSSFYTKSASMEVLFYEYQKDVHSPELMIRKAAQINLSDFPQEDLLIIQDDWHKIVDKIKEGKAEELSDGLTKYLGATTKGGKTDKNLTTQPFSNIKAHRRSVTFKTTYMTQCDRRMLSEQKEAEKVVSDVNLLKEKSFEDIVIANFDPYIGYSKNYLGSLLDVHIPKHNDKASSAQLARKMLNLKNDIQETDEFKKAGISLKVITVEKGKNRTTEGFKITISGNSEISALELAEENWEDSILRNYLSNTQFLFVVFQKNEEKVIFKGVKFWHMPYQDLENE